MAAVVCTLAAEWGYCLAFPTEKEEVVGERSCTISGIQGSAPVTESAETETCMAFASDLRTVRENLSKITEYAEGLKKHSHYLVIPIAEQERTKNTLLDLGKIVLDSSLITLTEQRRNRLRELILKTTKNLENVAKLNYDFCQQLEDVSLALAQ
ncbi:hypothetical protein EGR_10142 [Echinococcus granulosus]|uniref:Uncharacterized protein n=1 Tax=Echinococcus granulosus TaxID=6210 RepID=W6U1N1_ECHGR|nr:hypothetical protein EGR_10142 [Echinococcus granulosus]EUB55000.1 hypothetical protein EGR_10142 [Echinococcus granulosus]